jgi:hypothetical protein
MVVVEKINWKLIKDVNVLQATKKIKNGEELYWDYNRDCFCMNCKKWQHYYTDSELEYKKCSKCQSRRESEKYCTRCKGYICVDCYGSFQI